MPDPSEWSLLWWTFVLGDRGRDARTWWRRLFGRADVRLGELRCFLSGRARSNGSLVFVLNALRFHQQRHPIDRFVPERLEVPDERLHREQLEERFATSLRKSRVVADRHQGIEELLGVETCVKEAIDVLSDSRAGALLLGHQYHVNGPRPRPPPHAIGDMRPHAPKPPKPIPQRG